MAIRMSGLSSGLDTESLVSALVSSYNLQKDNLVKAQTKLSWKQDSWKTMNKSIYSFYSGSLSSARLSKTYNLKSATISNSTYAKVSASTSAVNGTQTLKIKQLASTGYLTGGAIKAADGTSKLSGSSKLSEVDGLSSLADGGSISATVDGKTKNIELSKDMTLDQLSAKLKDAGLNASFDATNQRMFVSSTTSGADHDFTLTANNATGQTALQNLGLYTVNSTDTAEYTKWASYADDSTKMAAAVKEAYDAVAVKYADRAKGTASAYNTAKKSLDAITSNESYGTLSEMNDKLADKQSEMSSKYDKYIKVDDSGNQVKDDKGNLVYDTDKMKEDNVLDDYNKLNTEITNLNTNIKSATEYAKTMADNEQYVNLDSDGNAVAVTDIDADLTKYNALMAQVDTENAATKSSIETEYTDKADFAKSMLAAISSGATGSTGAVRVTGQDSIIELNGAEFTNNTNNFSINGLTIQATAVTGDENVSITTDTDVDGIYDTIKDFLSEYNSLIKSMDTAYNAASAKGYEPLTSDEKEAMSDDEVDKWEQKVKDALLRKDTTLGSTSTSLKNDMLSSFTIGGKSYSLASFGISTLGYFTSGENEKGVYHIDGDSDDSSTSGSADKLRAAISNDPDTVISFFSQLATNVYNDLGKRMASSSVSSIYTIYNDKEMATEYSDYTSKISDKTTEISTWEDYYYKKFSRMESALASINSQSSSLSGLLG